jgi:hypothetical protein
MYASKLTAKVGEASNASLTVSSDVWGLSVLTVTKPDGSIKRWRTQVIVNCSVLGKNFNQFPTRLLKETAIEVSAAAKLEECAEIEKEILRIETNPSNVIGGLKAWNSGRTTELKPAVAKRLKALQKRLDQITATFEA